MSEEQVSKLVKQVEKSITEFHAAVMMTWNHGPSRTNPNE